MQQADRAILLYEGGGVRFDEADLHDCRSIALIVGSEGGFDPEEAEAARNRTEQLQSGWDTGSSAVKRHRWRRFLL